MVTGTNITQVVLTAGQTALVNLAGFTGGSCKTALTVKFDNNRSFVRFDQRAALEQAFAFGLTRAASGPSSPVPVSDHHMLIVGHTDLIGQPRPNEELSLRRARAVLAVFQVDPIAWDDIYGVEHWNGPNFELAQMNSVAPPPGSAATPDYIGNRTERLALFRRYMLKLRPDWLEHDEPTPVLPNLVRTPSPPILGCGLSHPLVNRPGSIEENRRVEFFFFTSPTPRMANCAHYPSRQLTCGQFISIVVELRDECGAPYSGSFNLTLSTGGVLRNQQTDTQGRYTRADVPPGDFTVEVEGRTVTQRLSAAPHNVLSVQLLRRITRTGTVLQRGGSNFRFFGTNAYYLLNWVGDGMRSHVEDFFRFMRECGIYVVRTWGFNEDQGRTLNSRTLVVPAGSSTPQINAPGIASLNTVVDLAEEQGIYLIITLADYNHHFGGICQYARWAVSSPARFNTSDPDGFPDHLVEELFYTGTITSSTPPYSFNFNPRDLYINYATHVINHFQGRTNILAWELMNEPRAKAINAPTRLSQIEGYLRDWIGWAAQTIRSRCPHLVSAQANQPAPFLSAGGVDINRLSFIFDRSSASSLNARRNIDLMDTHLYPENFGIETRPPPPHYRVDAAAAQRYLMDAVTEANTQGKPFYLGEFGIHQDGQSNQRPPSTLLPFQVARRANRAPEYQDWANLLLGGGASGMLFWQLLPKRTSPSSFTPQPPPPGRTPPVLVSRPAYDEFEINVDLVPQVRLGGPLRSTAPPSGSHFPRPGDATQVVDFVNRQLGPPASGGWNVC
jgi:hypothetical protein